MPCNTISSNEPPMRERIRRASSIRSAPAHRLAYSKTNRRMVSSRLTIVLISGWLTWDLSIFLLLKISWRFCTAFSAIFDRDLNCSTNPFFCCCVHLAFCPINFRPKTKRLFELGRNDFIAICVFYCQSTQANHMINIANKQMTPSTCYWYMCYI